MEGGDVVWQIQSGRMVCCGMHPGAFQYQRRITACLVIAPAVVLSAPQEDVSITLVDGMDNLLSSYDK